MSWDISIMKFSRRYQSSDEIPKDEKPLVLGSLEHVHECVLAEFPGTDWSDPTWGVWDASVGSIEFNLGKNDPAESMMLHVRAGSEVVPAIVHLCLVNGWQGIDCGTGDFIEQSQDPVGGLEAWASFRDQLIRGK